MCAWFVLFLNAAKGMISQSPPLSLAKCGFIGLKKFSCLPV